MAYITSAEVKDKLTDRNKAVLESISNAIIPCITSKPKFVPHWYLYDAKGAELFKKLIESVSYYSAEASILIKYAGEITRSVLGPEVIVSELAAGVSKQTILLLESLLENRTTVEFIPINIAKEFLQESAESLRLKHKNLVVTPIVGDYVDGIEHIRSSSKPILLLFLGGNFSNIPLHSMLSFLADVKDSLKEEDRFIIGIDLTQNVHMLEGNNTAISFVKNALTRLNLDFDSDFDLDDFVIHFNIVVSNNTEVYSHPKYIQLGLQSLRDHTIHLRSADKELRVKEGEKIYVHELENLRIIWNWKQFTELVEKAGFHIQKNWKDEDGTFVLACLQRA